MTSTFRKANRGKLLLVIVLLALSVLAVAELARQIARRPETLLKSQPPPGAAHPAGPLNASRPDLPPERLTVAP